MTILYIALVVVVFIVAYLIFGDEETQGGMPISIIVGFVILFILALAQNNS